MGMDKSEEGEDGEDGEGVKGVIRVWREVPRLVQNTRAEGNHLLPRSQAVDAEDAEQCIFRGSTVMT